MYYCRKIKTMLLLLLVCAMAKAQPESGKVYRFVNYAHPDKSLAVISAERTSISTTTEHYLQYWLLETHPSNSAAWTLRNLGNGKYLQHAGQSTHWGFVDEDSDATALYYVTVTDTTGATYCTFNSADNANGRTCMHYASSQGGVVGWESTSDATRWTMTEISSVTDEDLTANWEALDEFSKVYDDNTAKDYATALDALFADVACTALESTYASMSVDDIKKDDNYNALPTALQELVLKVRNDDWQEDNYVSGKSAWESEQAKKFRVQLYEPHSIAGDITSWLGINAHNNMDNPTGIFANYRDVVYVMVEGEIKEGALLYLYALQGTGQMGTYNDGNAVQLQEGLNVVPYISDGNALWVNYVVDTYNANGTTDAERFPYKLSDYEPLKINLVGGGINGYYNAVGDDLWGEPDDDNDWAYYKDRASLESFTLLSHRVTMQFYMYETVGSYGLYDLLDNISVPTTPYSFSGTKGTAATFDQYEGMGLDASTGKINIMLEAWNRITYSQLATLGVLDAATIDKMNEKYPRWYNNWTERGNVYDYNAGNDGKTYLEYCQGIDYSEYFNHHCLAISNTEGYMSGGWKSSNYHINTAPSIIDKIAYEAGPTWGPAHEIGHQHQGIFTLNGLTEVTNNLFSNIAVWYMGMGTSRVNGTNGSLASVLDAFNTEGSDYYTNNIWALTQMYYRLWLYYHLAGNNIQFYPRLMEELRREPLEKGYNVGPNGLLRFYKHCCVAAGEDLTEFFRAHGLLSVMTDRFVGDYSNSVYNQSQEQIDEAIAEVKALGLTENIAPLFISDATPDATYGHDGTTQREYWDGESTTSGNNAEVGSYVDYVNGEEAGVSSTYSLTGTSMAVDDLGGVGIAIFNEKGEIVAFSTKSDFEVSEECAALIASGKAQLKVVNADNTTSELVNIIDTDNTEAKYAALGELLEEVYAIVSVPDETGSKVGFYRKDAIADLTEAYNSAKAVYDEQTTSSYALVYEALSQAYADVLNDSYARIGIVEGNTYRLENSYYSGYAMSVNSSNAMIAEATAESSETQQWCFESSGTAGRYYIKNKSTSTYPGNVSTNVQLSADKAESTKGEDGGAYAYELRDMGDGLWALVGATGLHCNGSKNIIGWGADALASKWYITAVMVDATAESRYALEDLAQKTESLMEEMAEVCSVEKLELQTTSSSEAFYLSTNACHNTLNNESDGQGLNGLIDESTSTFFHSDYRGKVTETHYLQVDLGGGYEMSSFVFNYATRSNGNNCPTEIVVAGCDSADGTFTTLDTFTATDDGLPNGNGLSWKSPEISNPNNYRYLRFSVTATENSQVYFVMSTFGITNSQIRVEEIGSEYATVGLTEELLVKSAEQLLAADELVESSDATGEELDAMYSSLAEYYSQLTTCYDNAKNAAFEAKKTELQTLIANTNTLIGECGTVTNVETIETPLTMYATSGSYPYLTCSNLYNPNGVTTNGGDNDYDCAQLLDSDVTTYIHTDYSSASTTYPHYLQVEFDSNAVPAQFKFGYTTRSQGPNQTPKHIIVKGSNDGTNFDVVLGEYDFEDATNALPTTAGANWAADDNLTGGYTYLRFYVTKSPAGSSGATNTTTPYFAMSEFNLTDVVPEHYEVTLGENAGGATDELMIAAYTEVASAQVSYDNATTEAQVQAAINRLQADYDALNDAKMSMTYVNYTVQVVGGDGTGGVTYCSNNYQNGATFEAPQNLSLANLNAMAISGYNEGVVTLSGTTITVTYQKTYTVQVTGGHGAGALIYNSTEYTDGMTFNAVSIVDDELTAKVITGYYEGVITIDHENVIVSVVYEAIPLVDVAKYYTLSCKATDHSAFIRDNGEVIHGRSAEGSLFLFEKANNDNGYYIKSYVSDKYLNYDGTNITSSAEKSTIWTIAEFSDGIFTLKNNGDNYLNNNGNVNNTCPYLQIKGHNGGPSANNACSLWMLTEGEPLDKAALATLIEETNTLIESCYTDETFNYSGSLNVTEDLVNTTREIVTAAQEKYDSKATLASEYAAAMTALQTAKDNLQAAIAYAELPVQITFDANNPITYKIAINRSSGAYILEYDNSTTMVAVTSKVLLGAKAQAWYFMAATDGKVYIMPYHDNNTTLALSTNTFSEGNSKVKAMEVGADGYTQAWTITANADNSGWYNITCTSDGTDTWYFSNHGGVGNKMGFYNVAGDGGSLFKFEQVTIDKSEAYFTLYNYFTNDVKKASGNIVGGDAVGYYSAELADAYNTAYNNAASVLGSDTATDDDYTSAYNTLVAANETLVMNMPEEGKYYRLVSVVKGDGTNAVVYANPTDNKMCWSTDQTTADATSIWTIAASATDGLYNVTNLHTGTSINGFIYYNPSPLSETEGNVSIESLSVDGQVGIKCNGTMMHAQGGGAVVHWSTGANDASAWRIVEVEDMSLVKFSLSVSQYLHAGLYLNYAVTIPDGVKAYIIDGSDIDIDANGVGMLKLTKLQGTVLPAGNGYILDAPQGDYDFFYTEDEATDEVSGNMLGGSTYLTYREAVADHNYYVFGQKSGVVGLYKNGVKYTDSGAEGTTHYKVSANKVLFDWDNTSTQVASFRFRVDRETTDIENVGVTEDMLIYDLCGRRIMEVKASGLYIINGEKRYIEVK